MPFASYNEFFGCGSHIATNLGIRLGLQETSGSVASDDSPNSRDATIIGMGANPTVVAGPTPWLGSAFDFDGSDDELTVSNPPTPSSAVTLCVWVRGVGGNTGERGIVEVDRGSRSTYGILVRDFGSIRFRARVEGNSGYANFWNTPTSGGFSNWQHLAITYDSAAGEVHQYVDGVLLGSNSAASGTLRYNSSPVLNIGSLGGSIFSRCQLAEVTIGDGVALSAPEILEIVTGPEPLRTADGSHSISGTDATIVVPTYDSQSNGTATSAWDYRRVSDNALVQSGVGNATVTGLIPGESYYTFFRGSNNGGHDVAEDQTTASQIVGGGGEPTITPIPPPLLHRRLIGC